MHWSGWTLEPRHLVIWLGVVAVVGVGLSYISGLPYWGASAIIAAALIIFGLVAEIEDRSPGGFLNTGKKVSAPNGEPPSEA